MFDFIIEMDSEDLKLSVDGYSQGNMTIKGEHGSTRSEYTIKSSFDILAVEKS